MVQTVILYTTINSWLPFHHVHKILSKLGQDEDSHDEKEENEGVLSPNPSIRVFLFCTYFSSSCKGESEPGGVRVDIRTGSPNIKL